VTDREKMEGYYSTGQSLQWAVVPVEEEEEEEECFRRMKYIECIVTLPILYPIRATEMGQGDRF
jgi:hypothetical protein